VADSFDLEEFVEKCPFTLTGADFYALASDAMLNALKRKIKQLESGNLLLQLLKNNLTG
jgi:peroxin-6